MTQELEITVGAAAQPICEQLGCTEDRARKWQKIHDAITTLEVHGVASESETNEAGRRLGKMIEREFKGTQAERETMLDDTARTCAMHTGFGRDHETDAIIVPDRGHGAWLADVCAVVIIGEGTTHWVSPVALDDSVAKNGRLKGEPERYALPRGHDERDARLYEALAHRAKTAGAPWIVVPLASPDTRQWFDTEEQMNTWLAGYWAAHRPGRTTAQGTA